MYHFIGEITHDETVSFNIEIESDSSVNDIYDAFRCDELSWMGGSGTILVRCLARSLYINVSVISDIFHV